MDSDEGPDYTEEAGVARRSDVGATATYEDMIED